MRKRDTIRTDASELEGQMNNERLHEKIVDASKVIFSYCMSKTRNRADAEDLSQDILCELVKSVSNIRDDSAFYGFMWAVAGNVYKKWCKKRARINECELDYDIPATTDSEYEAVENEDDIYLLRRELALLSERFRKATIYHYIDRKSCSEIALLLQTNESTVKYLLFKSRNKLKEGMNMERKLGTLSYKPIELIPLYNGSGPNRFWEFMQSRVRQNIVAACYNDSLTAEQISLEVGIPLAYLEDDISALAEKKIIIKDGRYYKANVIIITDECSEEIRRTVSKHHNAIADIIGEFLTDGLEDFKAIGFVGNDFSRNTLYWQMLAFALAVITLYGHENIIDENDASELPETAWGDHAYIWMIEKGSVLDDFIINFSQEHSRNGDRIHSLDYLPKQKGDHHDFYSQRRYTEIFIDIVRGNYEKFSEYDLEAVADMIKKGYVVKEGSGYRATTPVFTQTKYTKAIELTKQFVKSRLDAVIKEMDTVAEKILSEYTPKHLQSQVKGITLGDRFVNAVCVPTKILVERKILSTDWHPLEMPSTFVVLSDE